MPREHPPVALRRWAPVAPALLLLVGLFTGALLGAIRASLRPDALTGGWSLRAWGEVLRDPVLADALVFTAVLAAVTTVVAAPLAVAAAGVLRRSTVARAVFALPVLVPHLLVAVVLVFWVGPGGLAERVVGALPVPLVRDPAGLGIVLVYLVKEVPFLTLLVLAAWDPETEARAEAAAVAGAGRLARVRDVVLPAVARPLVTGSLLVAAFVIGSFEVPLVVGPNDPPTLAVFALEQTRVAALGGHARAAAVLLIAATITIVLAALASGTATGGDPAEGPRWRRSARR